MTNVLHPHPADTKQHDPPLEGCLCPRDEGPILLALVWSPPAPERKLSVFLAARCCKSEA